MILDEIRTIQKRQVEHENHLLKKTEEMQGNQIRSTVKAANRKFVSFLSSESITFIYRAFQL